MGLKLVVAFSVIFTLLIGLSSVSGEVQKFSVPRALNCSLSPALVSEIASYSWLTQLLVDNLIKPGGSLKGLAYNYLADFTDRYGSRLTGTKNLESSIDYINSFLVNLKFQNVHTETVTVPVWERGNESLYLIQPRYKKLDLLGLGSSVGTPPEGVTAEIIVVESFDELDQRAAEVPGKIVVFNQPFISYNYAKDYREFGASAAAKYGAVAALIRSLTTFSIYSPHGGIQVYNSSYSTVKIPAACITIEDADMFSRMVNRGTTVQLKLSMEARNLPDSTSRNTIADIAGTTLPNEYVVTSGHIDSWDIGEGAVVDAAGTFVGVVASYALRQLGVSTARTRRTIAWTGNEQKLVGSTQFVQQHASELGNYDFVTESASGTFQVNGFSFAGNNEAACIIQEILKLAEPLNITRFELPTEPATDDTEPFREKGVPTGSILTDDDEYLWYHHTAGDTLTVEDPDELDSCVALTALVTGVVADLSIQIPRG